ncbi:hypothetical protein ONZ45_g2740 [Pleurotus djamor]|nr:hypothetical protein ONZ45_g2740 [Pleurotus djamor]
MRPIKSLFSLGLLPLVWGIGVAPGQIRNLVTFGDSYTDVVLTGDGGTAWPVFAADLANVNLFPFARAGATCSNNLTFRPFPPLFESQLPLYFEQKANGTLNLDPRRTVYTLWIGTNDVGMIPLELVPLYAADSWPNRYWTAVRNTTEWSVFMRELTLSGNAIAKLMLQDLAKSLRGAHIALFDSHTLFQTMFDNPSAFLNGTAPLNVTGAANKCVFPLDGQPDTGVVCTTAQGTDRDSFLWFDELHPSEQADRIVAREIAAVIQGKRNKFSTWLS